MKNHHLNFRLQKKLKHLQRQVMTYLDKLIIHSMTFKSQSLKVTCCQGKTEVKIQRKHQP